MKITFLGTGAADWPITKAQGVEHRRLSSVLIDDILLIDPGPMVLDAMKEYGKNPRSIKYIINTHRHSDHYNENTLSVLLHLNAEFIEIKSNKSVTFGKYTVYAFDANHSTCKETQHFIVSDGTKKLFYGLDGSWLLYDEVQAIINQKMDFAVLDGTIGEVYGDYRIFEHNNLRMVIEMKTTLNQYIKRFCISHIAKTLHTDHVHLAENMKRQHIEVAYDGWETEI